MAHPIADRLREPFGLLVDLLEHERLVARALGDLLVPVDLVHLRLDRVTALRLDVRHAVGPEIDDDTVVGILDAARLGQERGQVGREEVLAAAETDDQRRLMPDCDEPLRLVVVDDDEGEMPFEPRVSGADRVDEVAVVERLEQVCDDFGVRLGTERMSAGLELAFQLAVVLDDAVEHDRELSLVAAGERMRVVLVHRAVRRPARMTEAGRRGRAVRACGALEVGEVPDRADVVEPVLFEQRNPGRVVAAELESLEARDQ